MELDALTIRRAQQGDRRAQDVFLTRYAAALHSLLRRAGSGADLEDLTQALLEKLLVVLPRFELEGSATLTTWVFSVAHRWMLDHHKRRHLTLAPLAEALEVHDAQPRADVWVERAQLRGALDAAIRLLPEAQRRVFVLAQVHGCSLEQIAVDEGVPVGTVKSRLHRARAALMLQLDPPTDEAGATRAID